MEQEILTKPVTLRDALGGLRHLTATQGDAQMPASLSLLQSLTQYCQLESAAIFVAGKETNTRAPAQSVRHRNCVPTIRC